LVDAETGKKISLRTIHKITQDESKRHQLRVLASWKEIEKAKSVQRRSQTVVKQPWKK
jgi:hypothetical protein